MTQRKTDKEYLAAIRTSLRELYDVLGRVKTFQDDEYFKESLKKAKLVLKEIDDEKE